ncbi:MAG TPA: HlyD family efflux transporter periplasmic adaptor subunit [Gemmatimonadaceae bacterium]|nr:HlyD family efflux transporter periplasmic adaptor subunit [Gemmatimonadaceae bacterium]
MRHLPPRLPALLLGISLAGTIACRGDGEPDAYGNFEAIEVVVSAQSAGQLVRFLPVEGMRLEADAVVALVDTTQLALERDQLVAQRGAAGARRAEVNDQVRALEAQREIAARTLERTRRLHAGQAATQQQLDQAERDFRVLDAQLGAARSARAGIGLDMTSTVARVAQVSDRLARSEVRNPTAGTVLATYARTGEVVQTGQPLYRVADLDTLELRAYVSGAQLARVKLRQRVAVHFDGGDGALRTVEGEISWIAGKAEFTPTPVQMRDERADLVYAMKVLVANPDGALKIGMPADVTFAPVQRP